MSTTYGPRSPLSLTGTNVFRGGNRTNGFLMRNSDGRIPAIQEGMSSLNIGGSSVLLTNGIIPWGNALWRDMGQLATKPSFMQADKPTVSEFAGILKFEQGIQTGHPVAGWGLNAGFMKGTLVRSGLVGYKQTMTAVGQEANYLAYLMGTTADDTGSVRKIYSDWVGISLADGDRLGLFFGTASGFPIIAKVLKAQLNYPLLTGCVFAGFVEVYEKENQAVFVDIRQSQMAMVAPST